jgi:hypothetical protein
VFEGWEANRTGGCSPAFDGWVLSDVVFFPEEPPRVQIRIAVESGARPQTFTRHGSADSLRASDLRRFIAAMTVVADRLEQSGPAPEKGRKT